METPLTRQVCELNSKVMQDELHRLGLKVNHHEENIRLLKSEINAIEESRVELGIKLGNYHSSVAAIANNDTSVQEAEQRTIQGILSQDKTAAGIICQLKACHYLQASKMPVMKDVLGIVATLGKVKDDNLSRLLSEYLGMDIMLGLICKTYDGVKCLETYDKEGIIDKSSGIHGLGCSIGKFLDGRFSVFCLENMRPFSGDVRVDDPQRKLILHKPRLPSGESPPGFLGFAVNMIHLDQEYLSCLTANGHGLRETLFYSLFSHLQVYKTRADLRRAIPLINDGAISLDGGILRPNGSFCLGDRNNVEVKFTVTVSHGVSNLPGTITEMEEQVKLKNWEKERLLEDMKREEDLLNQVKDLFSKQKQQLMDYLTQSAVEQEMAAGDGEEQGMLLDPSWDGQHRCRVWSSGDRPPPFVLRGPREHWPLDDRYVPVLRRAGLLPIARMMNIGHSFTLDSPLLSALVDRWRPETHTFHFRWGEMTITLQDVAYLTGLPIRGRAVVPPPKSADWKARLLHRFGHPIPDKIPGVPHSWLRRYMHCPADASPEVVRSHLVAYLLFLFGWILFPTTQGDWVYPSYIHLAESLVDAEIDEVPLYSWGSAVLCSTYRGLCDGSQRATGEPNLAVCYTLLQLWSWEHFPVGRPYFRVEVHPYQLEARFYGRSDGEDPVDGPTMGTRWTASQLRWSRERPRRVYSEFHNAFETLHEDAVVWMVWTAQFISETAPFGLSVQCEQDRDYWFTTCHLVFSHMVEPYAPQRVMRQFGLHQQVPPAPGRPLPRPVHLQTKKGRKSDDWRQTQLPWTTMWEQSVRTQVEQERRPYDPDSYTAYLQWYVPRTRCRLTGPPPQCPMEATYVDKLALGPDRQNMSKSEISTFGNIINDLKDAISAAESRTKSAEARCAQLTHTNIQLNGELNSLKSQGSDRAGLLEKKLKESDTKLEHAKASAEAIVKQHGMLKSSMSDMEQMIEDLRRNF